MLSLISNLTSICYRHILKPLLFKQDPENVHDRFTLIGHRLGQSKTARSLLRYTYRYNDPILSQKVNGIPFSNPFGLSGGFDKNGNLISILPSIGFGYMQVGTVTIRSYPGNTKPRLYRLPKSKGIVVYYGLKNDGIPRIIERIKKSYRSSNFPLGISIGMTNCQENCDMQAGIEDYVAGLTAVQTSNIADLYTINISCPNTFGGEPFITPNRLEALLTRLDEVSPNKPLWVKMPINLDWQQFKLLLDVLQKHNIQSVVIGNLNKNHQDNNVKDTIPSHVKGGISGLPTQTLCNELISQTYQYCGDKLSIVGVGGIFSVDDAWEKITRGASLVQLITGLIFEGPQLIGQLNRDLAKRLRQADYTSITDAIGSRYK